MLNFSKIISSKSKNIVKESSAYFSKSFVEMNVSKLNKLFDEHVLKWPKYYSIGPKANAMHI
jgi:hypothetical protein